MSASRSTMDQKAQSLANLQEAFRGSLEPEVVHLILTESNYNVDDTLEKLLSLSNMVSSSDNCTSNPDDKTTLKSSIAARENFTQYNSCEKADGTTSRIVKKICEGSYLRDGECAHDSQTLVVQHKGLVNYTGTSRSTVMLEKENESTDKLVNSLTSTNPKDLSTSKDNSCQKTENLAVNSRHLGIDLSKCHRSPDMKDPEFTDSFNTFVQQFKSGGSDEWSSVSYPRELHVTARPVTRNSIDPKKLFDKQFSETFNFDCKMKEPIEPNDFFLKDYSNQVATNLGSTIQPVQAEIEITDHPLTSNELPPWPDLNHSYLHHVPPFHGSSHNVSKRYNQGYTPHHFQKNQSQRLSQDPRFLHYITQYQPHHVVGGPNTPPVWNAFGAPSIQYQPNRWHPGQTMTHKDWAAHDKRDHVLQLVPGIRKPVEYPQAGNENTSSKTLPKNEDTIILHGKVLVILRGLPGSGKTTLAQKLKGDGLVLSTDDYFVSNGLYQFDGIALGEAHEWNQKRAKYSMQKGVSPVIIDNTNTQAWEMRPYVSMAQTFGYQVVIKEPDTPWKWNVKELFKRNQHNVTLSGLQSMKDRYEEDLTVEKVLGTNSEKQRRYNPNHFEIDNPKNVEKQKHNCEKDKPISSVVRKDGSCTNKTSQANSAQELSSDSVDKKDRSLQNQAKSSGSSANPASSELSKQSEAASQKTSKTFGLKTNSSRTRQEMSTLKGHGSRSPIQDIDFSLSELSCEDKARNELNKESLDESDTVIAKDSLVETSIPKPQRMPKTRDRKTLKSDVKIQKYEDMEENLEKVFDCGEEKKGVDLCEKKQREECMSQYGKVDVQKFTIEYSIANDENAQCVSVSEVGDEKPREDNVAIPLEDRQVKQTRISGEEAEKITTEENSTFLQEVLSTVEPLTIKEKKLETQKEKDCNQDTLAIQCEVSMGDGTVKQEDEKNGIHCIEDGSDSLNINVNFTKTNDSEDNFKHSEIDLTLWNSRDKTGKEKCSLGKSKSELSESELSGFQFLNTCFPDTDVQIILDVLAQNQGDVTKAVDSILCHEDNSSAFERNTDNESASETVSSQPVQQPSLHGQGSFQMILEPAVAVHLLELFGPIDGINLEGDFSTDDLIMTVDSVFAKLLYDQWRTTIQSAKAKFSCTGDVQKQSQGSRKKESTCNRRLKQIPRKQSASQKSYQAADLREIMSEQMALQQSRQEQKQSDSSMAVVLKRQKLFALFPGVDPLALEELFEANGYELETTVSMVETSCNLRGMPAEFQEMQNKEISVSSNGDSSKQQVTAYQALQDPDYVDFRAEANTHYKLRDECFRKAAFAFSKKQGQLAQFYASQGHIHTEKIRQANRRAAARILEHKNSDGDQNSLDLHGLHVNEALLALEERLNLSDSPKNHQRYLSVITGQGIHSKQGKAKIKPAILEYLQRKNYRFEEQQPGVVRVSLNK